MTFVLIIEEERRTGRTEYKEKKMLEMSIQYKAGNKSRRKG